MVPQSPRLWLLAIWDRCQHTDAQSTVPGALCGSGGKYYRKICQCCAHFSTNFFTDLKHTYVFIFILIYIHRGSVGGGGGGGGLNETPYHQSSGSDP